MVRFHLAEGEHPCVRVTKASRMDNRDCTNWGESSKWGEGMKNATFHRKVKPRAVRLA